jgi:hypothetical protein
MSVPFIQVMNPKMKKRTPIIVMDMMYCLFSDGEDTFAIFPVFLKVEDGILSLHSQFQIDFKLKTILYDKGERFNAAGTGSRDGQPLWRNQAD